VTAPIDRGAEIRCYMRDPDGYLIEVGQSTGLLEGSLAKKRPEDLPGRRRGTREPARAWSVTRGAHETAALAARDLQSPLHRREAVAAVPGYGSFMEASAVRIRHAEIRTSSLKP